MLIIYAPADGDRAEWTFDPEAVRQSEAAVIQKAYGGAYGTWTDALDAKDADALRVLLWHLLRRDHPMMPLKDVPDFAIGELTFRPQAEDLQAVRRRIDENPALTEAKRAELLADVDSVLAEMGGPDLGKATSKKRTTTAS